MRRIASGSLLALVLLVALALAGCRGDTPRSTETLTGAGATLPMPLYTKWFSEHQSEVGTKITYTPSGSPAGIDALIAESVDFGASDTPLSDDQLQTAGAVVHVPLTLGAVAVVYNIENGPEELRLTGDVLAAIYLGEIKEWNDSRIAQTNPGVTFPARPIRVVARGDGSGTTKVFTEYLSRNSGPFKEKFGARSLVKWPVGYAATKSDGVATTVKETPFTIGYVELAFARANGLRTAALKNRAGRFVSPTLDSITAAAASTASKLPADLRATLTDAEGNDSYPIASYSYAIVYEEQANEGRGIALARFLQWAVRDGQRFAPVLHYGSLPPDVVLRAQAQIRRIKHAGKVLVDVK